MGGIVDRGLKANSNDGGYPGIGSKALKNMIDFDPDGFYAVDGSLRLTIPDGPTQSFTFTPDLQNKIQLIAVQVIKTGGQGGGGDTVQVFNGPNPVSEAISLSAPNKQVIYGQQIDATQNVFQNSAPITVTRTKVSNANAACIVFLNVARSA